MEGFKYWLIEFSRFSGVAGCLYYLFVPKPQKKITVFLFLILLSSLVADNFNFFFIRFIYPNGHYVGNAWQILHFILSIMLFRGIIPDKKKIFNSLLAIYLIGGIVSFLMFFSFSESNTFIRTFSNSALILCALLLYMEILKTPGAKLKVNPYFWIATSYFVYNSLLLIHGIFKNYLIFDLKISAESYSIIAIINLISNIAKNVILFYTIILLDKGFSSRLDTRSNS